VGPLHGNRLLIRPTPAEVALRADQESRWFRIDKTTRRPFMTPSGLRDTHRDTLTFAYPVAPENVSDSYPRGD
jgi:hypothetical protein